MHAAYSIPQYNYDHSIMQFSNNVTHANSKQNCHLQSTEAVHSYMHALVLVAIKFHIHTRTFLSRALRLPDTPLQMHIRLILL